MTKPPPLLRPATAPVSLADAIPGAPGAVQVSGISLDSRLIAPGDLYVALPGTRVHGIQFAAGAIRAGAVAILTDRAGGEAASPGVPVVVVDDPRAVMAGAAAIIYGNPADRVTGFALTGTNGKTTTAFMLAAALQTAGHRVGTIGTIGYQLDGVRLAAARTTVTTPESVDLQALLAVLVERGATAVAMEVSSHALALNRVDGIRFDVAGFTNFGQDHLDFHRTLENYFEAKAALFTPERTRAAVVNLGNPAGTRLAERIRRTGRVECRTIGWETEGGDYRIRLGKDGLIDLHGPAGQWQFRCSLAGDHNVRNAATALAMLDMAGVDPATAAPGLADMAVPGRMQRVELPGSEIAVYVDFAHTPQAVRSVLEAFDAERRAGARVVCVIGCGGNRDTSKRRPMGAVAAAGADVVVVTDDNPRHEDPQAIRAEVLAGARDAGEPATIIDGGPRREALAQALELAGGYARDGAQVIIAVLGKGHEQGQQVGEETVPFDDAGVVAEEWHRQTESATAGKRQEEGR